MEKIELDNLSGETLHRLIGGVNVPRPVALISTVDKNGVYNAAPYSTIASVCFKPPIYSISFGRLRGRKKDTLANIEDTGDFVINIMDETMIKQTIQTGANYPSHVDEISEVGFTAAASERIESPRVAEAAISLECRMVQRLQFGRDPNIQDVIFGEVLLMHAKDGIIVNGFIDPARLKAVGRLGDNAYCRTGSIFLMKPDQSLVKKTKKG
ncbi:MAG: flavin reductase family protein [Syntrophales bacterium LBB04]|nr:flavin reductase family protein [Syntrophales bacterium LBB04]